MTSSILIIGASWVGDMIMTQPLFRLLKQRFPGARLDVLAPAWSHGLLARIPEVDNALTMPIGHGKLNLKTRYRLGRKLAQKHYDRAVVIPNSWKSALIPLWANIPIRTGWRGEWRYGVLNDVRRLDKNHYPLMVQRLLALGLDPGAPLPSSRPSDTAAASYDPAWAPSLSPDITNRQALITKHKLTLDNEGPIIGFCPGAQFGPAKQWPSQHFGALAKRLLASGAQVWLFGSQADQAFCQMINAHTDDRCRDFSGATTLADAIDLISLSTAIVSNDSGLMHIAAALAKPLVALYGSSSPTFTPPLNPAAKILSLNLPCSPCFKRTCPLEHLDCLNKLSPEHVLTTLLPLCGLSGAGTAV